MTRSSSTLILAGALAAGCSKPNPLFLDTWGEVSDSGTSGASTLTGEPMTTAPPTSTTQPPPTTGPGTTSTSDGTTSSSTSEGTTGEPFFCNVGMDGCCELRIGAEADSFFTDAVDGAQPEGCPFVADPPLDYVTLHCGKWSFGKAPTLKIFNDYDAIWNESIKGASVMALRFPMKDGQLVADGTPIPWDAVALMAVELPADVDWQIFSDLKFDLYGLPADQAWTEGPGPEIVPCTDGNSCFYCRDCGADPNGACTGEWSAQNPLVNWMTSVEVTQGPAPALLQMMVPEPQALEGAPGGLVLVPAAISIQGQAHDKVPSGAILAHARESGVQPALRLKLCMP